MPKIVAQIMRVTRTKGSSTIAIKIPHGYSKRVPLGVVEIDVTSTKAERFQS